jgi:hypothetical protein
MTDRAGRRPLRARPRLCATLLAAALLALAATAIASPVQVGNLRVTVLSQVLPFKLHRHHPDPIAVFVSGHIASVNGETPPQLRRMTIKLNRHGLLQSKGLPTCPPAEVEASSTQQALHRCAPALIGSGQFWAHIVINGQPPYPTRGRLLIFNGLRGGQHYLIASIYAVNPFSTSFVIPFKISHIDEGAYGTKLAASFPQALGNWGFVDRIKLTLRRKYRYRGRELSYFNAACPAPADTVVTSFPLALVHFYFAGATQIQAGVSKACRVKP